MVLAKVSKDLIPYGFLNLIFESNDFYYEFVDPITSCLRITDDGLKKIGEALKCLSSLQSIHFNFERSASLTILVC